ncbi:Fc.00g106390.m01.CDS01 [Cosmosporella sp. VM-42]
MTIYNLEHSIAIPKDQNLTQLLHASAYNLPESHLIAADSLTNRSITLGELRDRAGRIANGFAQKLNPPDEARWAIVLPNSVEFLEVFHSILWTGGAVCPINYALRATEIGHGIAVCRPQFIVAYGKILPAIEEAIQVAAQELKKEGVKWQPPTVVTVISKTFTHQHIPDDFLASDRLAIPHWPDTTKRLASIHLSSGTTGKPKGVCLTHHNFVANVHQLIAHDASQFHPASRTVAFTPWAHIAMTTMPMFLGPYTGMFHHAMPSYNLETFAQLVGSNQATSFQGVPSVVLSLAKSDVTERYDFSKAAILNVGGAPLKKDDLKKLMSRAPWKMIQAFGMTEAAGYVAYQRLDETLPEGCTGQMLPGIEARLVKEGTGQDALHGGPGELWLRGPNITSGYAFNDEANQKGFPQEGWYNTGDVCTFSSDGRLSIVGRTKDLVKYKGFQVSPSELESYINSHPNVAESGVGALWDESQLTELPTAWVLLKPHLKDKSDNERRNALKEVQKWIDDQSFGRARNRGSAWTVDGGHRLHHSRPNPSTPPHQHYERYCQVCHIRNMSASDRPVKNASGRYDNVDFRKAAGYKYPPLKCSYNRRDVLLFVRRAKLGPHQQDELANSRMQANAIGVKENERHFLYELHPKFATFPTFPINLAFKQTDQDVFDFIARTTAAPVPGTPPFDAQRSVDGERGIEILKPIPSCSEGLDLEVQNKVIGVYDKGDAMILEAEQELVDIKTGTVYAKMNSMAFGIGQGGYNGPRGPSKPAVKPPNRAPDAIHTFQTTPEVALLYRLCGDYNPMHGDEEFGKRAGFKGSILHGLGTWNIAAHGLLKELGDSDPTRFRKFGARFKNVVYPGDELETRMWIVGSSGGVDDVVFETIVKGDGRVALSNGYAKIAHKGSKL